MDKFFNKKASLGKSLVWIGFVLSSGEGFTTVTDFQLGIDKLSLGITDSIKTEFIEDDTLLFAGNDYLGKILDTKLDNNDTDIWMV